MAIYLEMVKMKSATVRILHWLIFLSTCGLLLSGLYIGFPTLLAGTGEPYQTFVMAKIRLIHFSCAIVLDVAFLLRLYLAFFSTFHKDWKEVLPTPSNIREALGTLRFYWTLKGKHDDSRWVDPFDGLTFFALHMILAAQLFTGFALYAPGIELSSGSIGLWASTLHLLTNWTLWLFGGLTGVRFVHHLTLWIIVSGVLLHVYLQIWKTVKLGRADIMAIISGIKLMPSKRRR